MEEDLNKNGRRPKKKGRRSPKKMEENLKKNGRRPKKNENGRRPQQNKINGRRTNQPKST